MKTVTNRGPEGSVNDGGDTEVRFYYCGVAQPPSAVGWNICEIRDGSGRLTQRMLWGTPYTDELVWIEVNGDPSIGNDSNPDNEAAGEASESPPDMRHYVHQDRNGGVMTQPHGRDVDQWRRWWARPILPPGSILFEMQYPALFAGVP